MSSEKTKKDKNSGWTVAVRDARRQIEEAKARIVHLERSVVIFERKLKDGEPWPGEAATQN